MPPFEILIVAVLITLVAVLITLVIWAIAAGIKAEKARTESLRLWAHTNGWSFDPDSDPAFDDRYRHFPLFTLGHTRRARNTVHGTLAVNRREHDFVACDYSYKTTSTDSKGRTRTTTHHHSLIIFHTPYPNLPELHVRRENLFDKIGGIFGFDDIDFEDAEFSKNYYVKCADRRFAYDLLDPRMIEFLKEHAPTVPALHFERGQLLLYTSGRWKDASQFEHALRFSEAFVDRFPDHLLAKWENDSSFRTGVET